MLYKWDTIGHQRQLEQLEKEIKTGNISHAYLFSGPRDVGIFRIAKVFANILLCSHDYCRTCRDCKMIQSETHPDLILFPDNGESIKIDEVRDLIHKTNLTSQGNYRLVLIENIERMPIPAQNSFLKTLEEPAGKTIFLLTSVKANQVLATVKSRTRRMAFFSIEDSVLEAALRAKFGESPYMDEVIQMAQGRPGLAINLIQSPVVLREQKELYNRIEFFLKRNDLAAKFLFVEDIDKDSDLLQLFFDVFSRYLRKLIYDYLAGSPHSLQERFTLRDIVNLFESLEKTRYLIERNTNKKLALENFFLQTEK